MKSAINSYTIDKVLDKIEYGEYKEVPVLSGIEYIGPIFFRVGVAGGDLEDE